MEAHCSTGDPCGTVKEAGFFYLRNRCHVVFKKITHRIFSLRIYFSVLKYSTFIPERQYNPRKFLFSALLLIAFSSNYTMYSKPLYNLFLIFFLAAVIFIYFNRAFMILCAHRAQLCGKIRLFCCIFLFLRNYLFRMRLFAAGHGGWVGALWEGWQVCGARFPFFCGAMGTPRPCKTVCGVCGGGCVWWIARPPTGRRSPFTTGCGFAADMPFAFLSPLPCP